jgi:hypothetical protein
MTFRISGAMLIVIFPLLPNGPAIAQGADIRAALGACVKVVGALDRLACYDGVANAAASAAPPSAPRAAIPASAGHAATEQLGKPLPPPEQLTLAIASFQKDQLGRFTVTLSDGEVWRQVPGDTSVAEYSKNLNRSVTITPGLFGSYDLKFNGSNGRYKVARLR